MTNAPCWIRIIDEVDAEPPLADIYDEVRGPQGQLDNLYRAFSLRAHTIRPADDLYRAAMHHNDNTLPKALSELLGTYVARLTGCEYAAAHHGANFRHLAPSANEAKRILDALDANNLLACGDPPVAAALAYARQLCLSPESITKDNVDELKRAGWSDGEVLEIVQVVAMFSYIVRVINGVGIQIGDEKLGLF